METAASSTAVNVDLLHRLPELLEDYVWTAEALAGVALVLLGNLLVIARLRRRKAAAA